MRDKAFSLGRRGTACGGCGESFIECRSKIREEKEEPPHPPSTSSGTLSPRRGHRYGNILKYVILSEAKNLKSKDSAAAKLQTAETALRSFVALLLRMTNCGGRHGPSGTTVPTMCEKM